MAVAFGHISSPSGRGPLSPLRKKQETRADAFFTYFKGVGEVQTASIALMGLDVLIQRFRIDRLPVTGDRSVTLLFRNSHKEPITQCFLENRVTTRHGVTQAGV